MAAAILVASGCGTSASGPNSDREDEFDSTGVEDRSDDVAEQANLASDAPTSTRSSDRSTSNVPSSDTPSRTDDSDAPGAPDVTRDEDPTDDGEPGLQEQGPAPTAASASRNGPHQVKTYTSGYRNGPGYADSTIHYPEGVEGKLPAVSIVPGFVSPQSSIRSWGPFLASHGIIAMTIGTNSTSEPPQSRANALLDALETLRTEDVRAGGPLNGRVDTTRLGVMGWSMGGGGALIAAGRTASLKAAISMCGWNPGGQYRTMTVPSLMFAATSDPLAGGQSQGFYRSIPETTPKMLFEVSGGSHNIANNPRSLSGRIGLYGLSWLKIHLAGDDRYKPLISGGKPAGTAAFQSNLK
ncbi:MAG: hypothetical protein ABW252_22095 [Polyangiales bacterium]